MLDHSEGQSCLTIILHKPAAIAADAGDGGPTIAIAGRRIL